MLNKSHTFIFEKGGFHSDFYLKDDRYIVRVTDRVYKQMKKISKDTNEFHQLESSSREAVNLLTGQKRWFPAVFIWYCVNEGARLE